jgi:hypothetical protein
MPNFLGFALFDTLLIKWDFINIFYIALFQICMKCNHTVLCFRSWPFCIPRCKDEEGPAVLEPLGNTNLYNWQFFPTSSPEDGNRCLLLNVFLDGQNQETKKSQLRCFVFHRLDVVLFSDIKLIILKIFVCLTQNWLLPCIIFILGSIWYNSLLLYEAICICYSVFLSVSSFCPFPFSNFCLSVCSLHWIMQPHFCRGCFFLGGGIFFLCLRLPWPFYIDEMCQKESYVNFTRGRV